MKVLFCSLGIYSSMGGIQQFNKRVIQCLSELRNGDISSASVIVLWDDPIDARQCPANVEFTPCSRRKARMLIRFASMLLKHKPQLILYDHVLLAPLAVVARFLTPRARQIQFIHGVEVWENAGPFRRRIIAGLVHRISSVSNFTAAKMQQAYGLDRGRFALLPNAVDAGSNSVTKSDCNLQIAGEHRLLTVSRLSDRYKGHDKVILAMKKVLRAAPDTHYYIVGDGPLKEELRQWAERIGVACNVHFLGYLDNAALDMAFAKSHLFVMPSKGEGFGIVFLEAWKHKLPVIAGNTDASPEVVQHDVNGLLVNPDSPEEISAAILELLSNPGKRKRLGEAGCKGLGEKYTHMHFKAGLAEVLRSTFRFRENIHENPACS